MPVRLTASTAAAKRRYGARVWFFRELRAKGCTASFGWSRERIGIDAPRVVESFPTRATAATGNTRRKSTYW